MRDEARRIAGEYRQAAGNPQALMWIALFNQSITFSSAEFWPLDFSEHQVERGPWHIAPNPSETARGRSFYDYP
jgi:hypothetical protein